MPTALVCQRVITVMAQDQLEIVFCAGCTDEAKSEHALKGVDQELITVLCAGGQNMHRPCRGCCLNGRQENPPTEGACPGETQLRLCEAARIDCASQQVVYTHSPCCCREVRVFTPSTAARFARPLAVTKAGWPSSMRPRSTRMCFTSVIIASVRSVTSTKSIGGADTAVRDDLMTAC